MSEINKQITPGEVYSHSDLIRIFKVGSGGGIRYSRENNALVIVADHTKGLYDDKWHDNVLHYTGMGLSGDQDPNYKYNRHLNESPGNGIDLYLFEVFERYKYTYRGQVRRIGPVMTSKQFGADQVERDVVIFPLELIDDDELITYETFERLINYKLSEARNASSADLLEKAKASEADIVGTRIVISKVYEREPAISEYVKRMANGVCQLCDENAPFRDRYGKPYLESHHVEWVSKGGADTIENVVALCPNCHKKMHVLNLPKDIEKLMSKKKPN